MAAVGRFRRRVSSGSDPCDLRISSDGRYVFNPVDREALRHAVSCRVVAITYLEITTAIYRSRSVDFKFESLQVSLSRACACVEIVEDRRTHLSSVSRKRKLPASSWERVSKPYTADITATEPTPHTCAVWAHRRHPDDNHARTGTTETERYIQKLVRSTISEEIDRRKPREDAGYVGFDRTTSESSI